MGVFEKALEWFELAKHLLAEGRWGAVCSAAYKGVEFCLKGALLKRAGFYPPTEDLVSLAEALGAPGPVVEACVFFNRLGEDEEVYAEVARLCFDRAAEVLRWAGCISSPP